jgi:hypothetical protein
MEKVKCKQKYYALSGAWMSLDLLAQLGLPKSLWLVSTLEG